MAEYIGSPSIDQFAEELSQESDWYSLGIFLGAPTQELDAIGLNYRGVSTMRCLIELYKCLQSRGKTPSWELVANNLKRMNSHSLADRINSVYITPSPPSRHCSGTSSNIDSSSQSKTSAERIDVPSEIAKEFFSLKTKFTKLILSIKDAFVDSTVNLDDLQHVIKSLCGLKPFSRSEATFGCVFHRLDEECTIFVSHVLNVIIDTFIPHNQTLTKQTEEFENAVDNFKSSARMSQLVDLIKSKELNHDHHIVRLKVREFWGHFTIEQFEIVINELFRTLYSHLSHMSVVKGCYCISWIITGIDVTTAFELVPQHSVEFMKSIGIISLQIGEEMLYSLGMEMPGCEVLEAAMLQAIELKNTQAIELLLAVGCSPEVATYNEDNAITSIVNIREKKSRDNNSSTSDGMNHVCILGENELIEALVDPSREAECSSCRLKEKMMKHLQQENDILKHKIYELSQLPKQQDTMTEFISAINPQLECFQSPVSVPPLPESCVKEDIASIPVQFYNKSDVPVKVKRHKPSHRVEVDPSGIKATTGDLSQGCIRGEYPAITTSPSYHQPHSELFAVPSSSSFTPYSQAFLQYDVFISEGNMGGYPQAYSSDVQEHNSLDPIPIISCDQATGNPIRFYNDCSTTDLSPRPSFMDSITSPCATSYPSGPFHIKSDAPVNKVKRPRRPRPQVQVDPSDIKDVPASAQLWEFLLKVLKKPKYNYMVSWESRKDGLFRFHDPSAFAALWGRHRNRPNMTYDKVARALRYYCRREILEPVGGRLTYKFTPRLCKQFNTTSKGEGKEGAVGTTALTEEGDATVSLEELANAINKDKGKGGCVGTVTPTYEDFDEGNANTINKDGGKEGDVGITTPTYEDLDEGNANTIDEGKEGNVRAAT